MEWFKQPIRALISLIFNITDDSNSTLKSSVTILTSGISVTIYNGPYLFEGSPTVEAVKYYDTIIKNQLELKKFASDTLLNSYNNDWLDESIGQIDKKQFIELLSLTSIVVFDELGYATAYFDDGNLFAGHTISISLKDGHPEYCEI